jgi:hypothetical protein
VIRKAWLEWSFSTLLPWSARQSGWMAKGLTALRGWLSYILDADWRTLVHQDAALRQRTSEAFGIVGLDNDVANVAERYVAQAREEWIAEQLIQNRLVTDADFGNAIRRRLDLLTPTTGVIYTTIHWGESTVGAALLGDLGRTTWVMNSSFVESDAMPLAIRTHYQAKYRAMNLRLAPGRCVPIEHGLRPFMRHLQNGGGVAMTIDIPDHRPNAAIEQWFGRTCSVTPGLRHLVARTNSVVVPYVARCLNSRWRFEFAQVDEAPYAFFQRMIFQHPTAWWAADLFPLAVKPTVSTSSESESAL